MNIVVLKGNLARDPESREVTANGRTTTVVNFSIAVSRFFKKQDGTKDKDVTFIACEAWDTGAETIAKYVKKGDPILVHGSLKTESWPDKDNPEKKHSRTKVRVERFDKLYRAPKNEDGTYVNSSATSEPVPANAGPSDTDGDDIPF